MYNNNYVMTQQTRDVEPIQHYLMLAHGLVHCPNIKTTLAQHFVFAGDHLVKVL